MAPLKFEENIKEALSKREIKPSANSWDKLANRLDQEPKKNRYGIWWAIAAGIAGLALIGSLIFSNDATQTQRDLVETENVPTEESVKQDLPVVEFKEAQDQLANELEVKETTNKSEASPRKKKEIITTSVKSEVVAKSKELLKETPKQESIIKEVVPKELLESTAVVAQENNKESSKDPMQQQVDEVVTKIKELQATNSVVTEAEINALLEGAQKNLKKRSFIDANTQKVDAMALLDEVEFDLERSFRDKVFEALGDGFNKVRTAVAERNN